MRPTVLPRVVRGDQGSSKGSMKVADGSPLKIHRELKSILGDETIEVTILSSGDLMVELKSNDQAKKLGAIATFLDTLCLSVLTRVLTAQRA
ncbi:hypothetical protein PoB_005096800 [Plakobranchus ocellatus]|uniref:Uncharacterized protein n=1 Tax=Plakobranchus ocellatus TaxID=259542 RepID=A0AAV4C057_9GAST|nr:hypothetical protein PoB_005096800 [Plakobranchus ocellatus]